MKRGIVHYLAQRNYYTPTTFLHRLCPKRPLRYPIEQVIFVLHVPQKYCLFASVPLSNICPLSNNHKSKKSYFLNNTKLGGLNLMKNRTNKVISKDQLDHDPLRRKLTHLVWATPLISCISLPAHAQTSGPTLYAIGDTGPAGGKVFYVIDGGTQGLEAAPDDSTQFISTWGCGGTDISGTSTAVGSGAANTDAIIGGCTTETDSTAAEVARMYELNGFTDWFLPSKDELNLLYLQKDVVGGFASAVYWSSSQASASNAWLQFFDDGFQNDILKSSTGNVRAVRAFNNSPI
ncbi:MAG: hypothetical protein ACI9WC_000369 [Arenicella sp.]|jgi:hypothetical protein